MRMSPMSSGKPPMTSHPSWRLTLVTSLALDGEPEVVPEEGEEGSEEQKTMAPEQKWW